MDERSKLVRILLLNGTEDAFKSVDNDDKSFIIVPNLPDDKMVVYLED